VLLEQEELLCYKGAFRASEAFDLGNAVVRASRAFDHGVSVSIVRESDDLVMFQWVANDCDARNLLFASGKRAAARKAGHASPWAQLEAAAEGADVAAVWANVPDEVPACGAFPIRANGEWTATLCVSGLSDGLDHEVIVRGLERALGVEAPRWEASVA
jgi:uncharacterized protein (UPF0303 family)